MAAGNFQNCLKEILRWEGGYANHPSDPGGMTNLGVTKATYEAWIGYPVNEQIMRNLTHELVAPLYKKMFWDKMRCEALPKGFDLCVFDFGVNAGTGRSGKLLQKLVGVTQDGIVGPATMAAVEKRVKNIGVAAMIKEFQDARRVYYRGLGTFSVFGKGWIRRVEDIEQKSYAMAKVDR